MLNRRSFLGALGASLAGLAIGRRVGAPKPSKPISYVETPNTRDRLPIVALEGYEGYDVCARPVPSRYQVEVVMTPGPVVELDAKGRWKLAEEKA